jgi:hypothetical protein
MTEDLFKIVGIVILCCFLFYLAMKSINLQLSVMEGFLGSSEPNTDDALESQSQNSALAGATQGPQTSPGIGKGSAAFPGKIKAILEKLKSSMAVNQYKKNYEMTLLNLDDYFSYSMLDIVGSFDPKAPLGDQTNMDHALKLNTLNHAKESLNNLMKFVDRF